MGYYTTETDLFNSIQNKVRLNGHRHPLAFLLEAADDISYLTSDLQDAHHKGLIKMPDIKQGLIALKGTLQEDAIIKLNKIIDLFERCSVVYTYHFDEDILLGFICDNLRNALIDEAIIAFDSNYSAIMEGAFEKELLQYMDFSHKIVDFLMSLLKKYVYDESNIIESEIRASKILWTLLDIFVSAALMVDSSKNSNSLHSRIHLILSENYKHICNVFNRKVDENENLLDNEKDRRKTFNRVMLATDFICGMTDSYAKKMYDMITAQS